MITTNTVESECSGKTKALTSFWLLPGRFVHAGNDGKRRRRGRWIKPFPRFAGAFGLFVVKKHTVTVWARNLIRMLTIVNSNLENGIFCIIFVTGSRWSHYRDSTSGCFCAWRAETVGFIVKTVGISEKTLPAFGNPKPPWAAWKRWRRSSGTVAGKSVR